MALFRVAYDSSSLTSPHSLPKAQVPRLSSETRIPVWPRSLYSKSLLSLGVRQPVVFDDLSVPACARLGDAPLGAVVHEDDAEALGIALGPLEVVQQRPHHVAAEVHTLLHRVVGGAEVGVEVGDPLLVVHLALRIDVVVDGTSVLCNVDGDVHVLLVQADE